MKNTVLNNLSTLPLLENSSLLTRMYNPRSNGISSKLCFILVSLCRFVVVRFTECSALHIRCPLNLKNQSDAGLITFSNTNTFCLTIKIVKIVPMFIKNPYKIFWRWWRRRRRIETPRDAIPASAQPAIVLVIMSLELLASNRGNMT